MSFFDLIQTILLTYLCLKKFDTIPVVDQPRFEERVSNREKRHIIHTDGGVFTVSKKRKPTVNDDETVYLREQNDK